MSNSSRTSPPSFQKPLSGFELYAKNLRFLALDKYEELREEVAAVDAIIKAIKKKEAEEERLLLEMARIDHAKQRFGKKLKELYPELDDFKFALGGRLTTEERAQFVPFYESLPEDMKRRHSFDDAVEQAEELSTLNEMTYAAWAAALRIVGPAYSDDGGDLPEDDDDDVIDVDTGDAGGTASGSHAQQDDAQDQTLDCTEL